MQPNNLTAVESFSFRWLGINSLEFTSRGVTILVDPFLTRPSLAQTLFLPLRSNTSFLHQYIRPCHIILVTHSHHDHLLDVPEVIRLTGAHAYGSSNTRNILSSTGIPEYMTHEIQAGDEIQCSPIKIQVYATQHTRLPFDWLINGLLTNHLRPPLRFFNYKMDTCLSFRISIGEAVVQVGCDPHLPADILFISNRNSTDVLERVFAGVQPRILIPVHWDNITQPLSTTPKELIYPGSLSLKKMMVLVKRLSPSTKILIPTIFKEYSYGYACKIIQPA